MPVLQGTHRISQDSGGDSNIILEISAKLSVKLPPQIAESRRLIGVANVAVLIWPVCHLLPLRHYCKLIKLY